MQFNLIKKFKNKYNQIIREPHKNNGWNFVDEGALPDSDRLVQVILKHKTYIDSLHVELTTSKFTSDGWKRNYVYAWRELDDETIEFIENLEKINI